MPLMARLAGLGSRISQLPPAAAQAAFKLLASRLEVGTGGPDGKALKTAMLNAGVAAGPARAGAGDLKSALLQMRSGLAGAQGGEIEPVQAVAGRPPPPVRGDDARAVRAELPLPAGDDLPVRTLLAHGDGALARLKLLQHASQPPEARPGAPAHPAEFRVEVPLLLGAETGLLQVVVDREARKRDKPSERGWRMRFAMAFAATGEVGAEVALFGKTVGVTLWAERPAMEAAMADELETLRVALAEEGLDASGLRVRRRATPPRTAPGALMDSSR